MNSELEKKLEQLQQEYAKLIPGKVSEIETLWRELQSNWNADNLSVLHRKAHNLHGSAATYSYTELGTSAKNLELFLSALNSVATPSEDQKQQIIKLVDQLKESGKNPVQSQRQMPGMNKSKTTSSSEWQIYLYEEDYKWSETLIKQASGFGYIVQHFNSDEKLMQAIQQKKPDALLVDTELLNATLEEKLKNLTEFPILFISPKTDFEMRLKTIRLKGKGYLVKPFAIEELVHQLDRSLKAESEVYNVLIVDDELEVAQYYSSILEHGYMKTHIVTHAAAIDRALHEFKPDLILVDIYMPECSGTELATIIRQQSTYESIPIIFLSSEEDKLKQLTAMKLGADDFVTKATQPDHVILAVRNRAGRYKTLRSMMVKDSLTGVYNHSFILRQLDIELADTMRLRNPLTIAMIDLDNFKRINDTYGHLAGDQVLRNLCLMMFKRLRGRDVVGRYGGEEFLVVFPNTDLESAKKILDDLRQQFMGLMYSWNNQLFNATFSAGLASFPDFYSQASLVQASDEALYKAKNAGRNRIEMTSAVKK